MKKGTKGLLMTALICGTITPVFCGSAVVNAAEPTHSFDLPTILVEAEGRVVELPGGLVNETAKMGVFGNKSVMEIPYSEMSMTQKSVETFVNPSGPLQSVLINNPSIRTSSTSPMYSDFSMRGINMNGNHMMLNGIPSLFYQFAEPRSHFIERIDITSGPNAGVNGVSMSNNGTNSGATPAPGTINVVTKRAKDTPITRYTQTFSGRSNFGEYIDIGRRFGKDKEWGIRINGEYLDGELSARKAKDKERNIFVNLDHRSEKSNTNIFIGHWDKRVYHGQRWFTYNGVSDGMPKAPDSKTNYDFDGTVKYMRGWMFTVNHDQKIGKNVDWFVNAGHHYRTGYKYNSSSALKFNELGQFDYNNVSNAQAEEGNNTYIQTGFRGTFRTGAVEHNVFAAVDRSYAKYWNNTHNSAKGTIIGDLYNGVAYTAAFEIPELLTPTLQWDEVNTGITIGDSLKFGKWNVSLAASRKHEHFENKVNGQKIKNNNILPTYGVTYQPTENMAVYAGHTEAFSRGAVVSGAKYVNDGETLDPSTSKQNEIGIKIKSGKTLTTFSLFDIDQQSVIDTDLGGGMYRRAIDGRERFRGAELTFNGKPHDKWTFTGGLMYLDHERRKTAGGANDGKFVNGVAKFSGVLGAVYEPDDKWGIMGRVVTCGSSYIDNAASPTGKTKISAYTTLDLGVNYKARMGKVPVTVAATCFNVLNKDYWMGRGSSTTFGLSMPRTFLLSATFDL